MAKAEYLRLNLKYLKEAEKFLAKKDYPQASEKLWGAFVEAVKALASEKGIKLGTHRSIAEFVTKLHKEHREWDLMSAFAHAERLHVNFYEDHLPEDHVVESKKVIEDALKLMLKELR
ncbi:MAG: PaREP1 family protein [archaeon]|nr:PaREP1 family protein [archaeon]